MTLLLSNSCWYISEISLWLIVEDWSLFKLEYKSNEFQVPEDKREEVALGRIEGLLSIRDYIKSSGSKEQKFHYESSLKGALLYASSLGINIDEN